MVASKHANPCGVGIGETIYDAYIKAYESDPVSVFGGILAINGTVDEKTAAEINKIFIEIVIAEHFTPGSAGDFANQKEYPPFGAARYPRAPRKERLRYEESIRGTADSGL